MRVARAPLWLVALLALVWTFALRLPTFGAVAEDEVFFLAVGHNWLEGLEPYVHLYDVKPPGLFALAALALTLFGTSLISFKLLTGLAVALGAVGLFVLARRRISEAVAWWALVVFPYVTLFQWGVDEPTALVQAPFIIGAFLAADVALSDGRRRLGLILLAGVLMGAAGLIKQTALFEAIACAGWILWRQPAGGRVAIALAYGLGLSVVPVAFGLWFWSHGDFRLALDGAVLSAAERVKGDAAQAPGAGTVVRVTVLEAIVRFLPLNRPNLAILAMSVLAFLRVRTIKPPKGAGWFGLTASWLAAAAIGVIAVKSMYVRYNHPLLAPMVLASGTLLFHGLQVTHPLRLRAGQLLLAVAVLVVPWIFEDRSLVRGIVDVPAVEKVAAAVRAAGPRAGDEMLAVNRGLAAYLLSGVYPTARYVHPNHLLCDFYLPDTDPLGMALATRPRFVVRADRTVNGMVCERDDRHAQVAAELGRHYRLIGTFTGEWDRFELFERLPGA